MRGPPTVGLCLVCLGLLALPALPAFAAPPDPQAIVRHIQQGRYLTARDALHRLLFSEEGPLWRRRAVYLLGHVHLKLGDFEQAAQYFDQARTVLPTLSDYALYNAGVAEAGAGRTEEARLAFTELLDEEPESRLHPHALLARAEAAYEAEAWEPAQADYERLLAGWPAFDDRPQAHLRLGQIAEARGRADRALSAYKAAVVSGPVHPAAEEAFERLEALRAGLPHPPALWSAEEAFGLGEAWLAESRPTEALSAYEQARAQARHALVRGRAARGAAKAELALGRRTSAAARLRTLIRQNPRHLDIGEAHYLLGRALWNLNQRAEARTVLRRLLHRHRESPFCELAFYILGRLYSEQGSLARSAKAFRELAAAYPEGELAREGLWRMGWNAYRRGRTAEAAATFHRVLATLEATDWEDEVAYWLARARERSGQQERARERYRDLARRYPHTYYGQLAARRLARLGEPDIRTALVVALDEAGADASPLAAPPPAWQGQGAGRVGRALELAEMGFAADAQAELALAEAGLSDSGAADRGVAFALGALYHRAGLYARAIRRLNGPFAAMDPEEILRLNRRFWELYYPRPYLALIERASAEHDLDLALVLGLIRQESAFRAEAVSPAGAVGLMQVLPGRAEADAESLLDTAVNLATGTAHLARLLERYDGRIVDALVAYNAGVQRLERWRRHFRRLEDDEFVEAIPFTETRTYVKRVLRNAALYRMLFAEAPPGGGGR